MERSANHLPSHRHPPIHPHHYAPTSPSTAQPTIEHGIFLRHHARTVRSAVRLLGGVYRAIVVVDAAGVVWVVTRTVSRTLRNHRVSKATPARMVRSAVLLFGDVCRAIVVVDELGVVWVVTRTASRTLRNHRVSKTTRRAWYVPRSFFVAAFAERSLWSMRWRLFGW